jgi:surfeit locus 1 family protein
MKRRWPLLLLSLIATALLLNLGFWQLRRLEEKQALIISIDQRMQASAVELSAISTHDTEFQKIRLNGRFLDQPLMRKLTSHQGRPGFDILQPFLTTDNKLILVHRGSVPEDYKATPPQLTSLEAIIRLHNKGQGFFDPENDSAKGQWYWWDVPEMLASIPPQPNAETLPFIAQQIPASDAVTLPLAIQPKAELRNNHLGYAVTWFGLAAVTLLMSALWMFRRPKVLNP